MEKNGVQFVVSHDADGIPTITHRLYGAQCGADATGKRVPWFRVDQIAEKQGAATGGWHEAFPFPPVAQLAHQRLEFVEAPVNVADNIITGGATHAGWSLAGKEALETEKSVDCRSDWCAREG